MIGGWCDAANMTGWRGKYCWAAARDESSMPSLCVALPELDSRSGLREYATAAPGWRAYI